MRRGRCGRVSHWKVLLVQAKTYLASGVAARPKEGGLPPIFLSLKIAVSTPPPTSNFIVDAGVAQGLGSTPATLSRWGDGRARASFALSPEGESRMPAIQHVFVLVLENRSYDSIFGLSNLAGTLPGGAPTTANGLPAQPIVNFGRAGAQYQLR